MKSKIKISKKVALVVGGNSGIGKETARLLADQGVIVIIACRNVTKCNYVVNELKRNGIVECHEVDVKSDKSVKKLMEYIGDKYERLDYAFNSISYIGKASNLDELPVTEWNKIQNTNLRGVFLLMKYEVGLMKKRGSGSIVNQASVAGLRGRAKRSAYNASYAGVINLTKSAAIESIEYGIRINAIGIGIVATEGFNIMTLSLKERMEYSKLIPAKRFAFAEEIAEAVLWLLFDKSSFSVGTTLNLDGGATAW